ncbi:hypothetical protein TNCT_593761 [Trichonephila clavata]|uniref:Uncharacterized protein n=1 Tax=Trichonephila clavata TaxID=2740835 RepID=A0A8X6KNV6_TRICU|nr:hypothetical protein TNCT_593761 [Trichonephila clavata]
MEENFETRLVHSKKLESESSRDRFVVTVGFLSSVASSRASLKSVFGVWPGGTVFHPYGTFPPTKNEESLCVASPGCDVCSVHL